MTYIQLEEAMWTEGEAYTCKAANIVEEAQALIEVGYEYVTEVEGTPLFRKKK